MVRSLQIGIRHEIHRRVAGRIGKCGTLTAHCRAIGKCGTLTADWNKT